MSRPTSAGGPQGLAHALRKHLSAKPFTQDTIQWGIVAGVHGSTSTMLTTAASEGDTTIYTAAAPLVNDLLVVGSLPINAVHVTAITGSGPYTVTIAPGMPTAATTGASVTALPTLDVYLNGAQNPTPASALTWGIRYYYGETPPQVGAVVPFLRGIGGLQSDRFGFGSAATSGFVDPMTTEGDMIYEDVTLVANRLPIGTTGEVLTVVSGLPAWASPSGFVDPMTTAGDIIYENTTPVAARLPIGSSGEVLTVVGGLPAWATPSSGPNPFDYPPDQGFLGWSSPPEYISSSAAVTSTSMDVLVFCKAAASGTVNYLYIWIVSGAAGLTANANYLTLYQPNLTSGKVTSFTLLGASAAGTCDTLFGTDGTIKVALASGVAVTAGTIYYIGLRYAASGHMTALYRSNTALANTVGLFPYPYVVVSDNGGTSPASTITIASLGGLTESTSVYWAAMSE